MVVQFVYRSSCIWWSKSENEKVILSNTKLTKSEVWCVCIIGHLNIHIPVYALTWEMVRWAYIQVKKY